MRDSRQDEGASAVIPTVRRNPARSKTSGFLCLVEMIARVGPEEISNDAVLMSAAGEVLYIFNRDRRLALRLFLQVPGGLLHHVDKHLGAGWQQA